MSEIPGAKSNALTSRKQHHMHPQALSTECRILLASACFVALQRLVYVTIFSPEISKIAKYPRPDLRAPEDGVVEALRARVEQLGIKRDELKRVEPIGIQEER